MLFSVPGIFFSFYPSFHLPFLYLTLPMTNLLSFYVRSQQESLTQSFIHSQNMYHKPTMCQALWYQQDRHSICHCEVYRPELGRKCSAKRLAYGGSSVNKRQTWKSNGEMPLRTRNGRALCLGVCTEPERVLTCLLQPYPMLWVPSFQDGDNRNLHSPPHAISQRNYC